MEYAETIMNKRGLFDRLVRGRTGGPGVIAANQTIAVYGTQGGVGTSCLTAVLSKTLHRWGFTVLVVEAAASGGSFLRLMGKRPANNGLDTISKNREKMNSELEDIKVNIIKGLSTLPRSGAPYNTQWAWKEEEALELLRLARKMAGTGFMVVDAGNLLSDALSRAALIDADHIVSLFRPTDMGIDAAIRFYEQTRYANLSDKLIWIANQAYSSKDSAQLAGIIEQKINYCIPWENSMKSMEQGDKVPQNVQSIAEELLHNLISAPSARVF